MSSARIEQVRQVNLDIENVDLNVGKENDEIEQLDGS